MATQTSPTLVTTTSAFVPASPPSQRSCLPVTEAFVKASKFMELETNNDVKKDVMESETEDEEVKMNCVGGFRGVEDSDMNTSDDDDESLDGQDEEEDNGPDKKQGVVNFVSKRVALGGNSVPLLRPKAHTPPRVGKLSPHEEGDEKDEESDSSSSDSSRSSIGARGVPLQFGTPSALSEASMEDLEDDGEREDYGSDDESMSSSSSTSSEEGDDLPTEAESSTLDVTRSSNNGQEDIQPDSSADTKFVEEQNDDDELSDILQSLGEDRLSSEPDELDSSERYIGVMEDRENLITIPKTKRVLSYNTLAALNIEARGSKEDSPKRLKSTGGSFEQPSLISLGSPAMSAEMSPVRLSFRRESPIISSSDEEEELDRQLGAELRGQTQDARDGNNTPVPLLTPPGSPLTVQLDGDTTTVCEWPSNLTVDSAMAAASELRPMSPASLADLEHQECQRSLEPEASALAPLLQGIYVGD